MSSRLYVATFTAVAATAVQDLFEVVAAAGARVQLHGWEISQSTEAGDAADEMVRLELVLGYTVSGSGGSAFTPLPIDAGIPAFGGTCETNNSTVANTGTAKTMHAAAFNVRAGHLWIPTPEMRIWLAKSERAVLRLNSTPADSISFSGTLYFEEE
ncbi:MAG: hypothetical protein H0U56_04210 [Methylibium sp.]|nr:hypothetical protein [Methylibium sp.]